VADGLRVVGAKELREAMRRLQEPAITNALKDIHLRVATVVITQATRNAASLGRQSFGHPKVTEQGQRNRKHRYGGIPAPVVAASTLRSGRSARGATVTLGSNRVPFALGHEWGANQDRERTRRGGTYVGFRQFPVPARRGYFLFRALGSTRDAAIGEYLRGLDQIINHK